ncbi:phage holin [Staphylococcus coagulans]|uniref:phage holin n=1 Tax=Staphylococcus coagulans TaxID=74706 RepID=UPI001F4C1DDF|nr:phage holin [Staphylococcus coagulans]UNB45548.1 phage holin [Staphylococcus coagulans]
MKINWTNRLKNGATLSALIGTLFLLVKQVTEIFGIDISNQLQMASGIVGTILTLLAGLGIITNPNTKGVSDAGIDMQLSKPRNQDTHPVVFEKDSNSKNPKFYDTSQPFTDDSRDVVFDVNQYDANERERGL